MNKALFTIIAFVVTISPIQANLDSLLTGINKIEGLKLAEVPQKYVSNDLFVMINGGAETYLEYGFQQALDAKYILDNSGQITVQIYEMIDDGAAFGIFTSSRNEGDSAVPVGDFASGNDYYIMVQKSRFYFVIATEENTPELQKTVVDLATSIAAEIKEKGTLPQIADKVVKAGFDIKNLKYLRGKIALSGNYFFTHKEIFKTRDALCIEEGESKIFIFQYPDNSSATSNLKFINEELVSSGRFTQFIMEDGKYSCLDKNLKHIKLWVSDKYIIVMIGKGPAEEKLKEILSLY